MTDDPWSDLVQRAMETKDFEPMVYYNAAGDSLEFHLSNETYRAKRLDSWLTVFISETTGKPVGGTLKGVVNRLLVRFPGLVKIEVRADGDERYPLSVLLKVAAYDDVDDSSLPFYLSLIQASEESDLTTSLQEA